MINYYSMGSLYDADFKAIYNIRKYIVPKIRECGTCRYMNYAKGYEQFKDKQYSFLRHRNFL